MTAHNHDEQSIYVLLEDLDLKLVLESENRDYKFEYSTSSFLTRDTKQKRLSRTYKLIDLNRGYETVDPWDAFDLSKQTVLVTNLIRYGGYRIAKKILGWKVTCPNCSSDMHGKIWEMPPRVCRTAAPKKCGAAIPADLVLDIEEGGTTMI